MSLIKRGIAIAAMALASWGAAGCKQTNELYCCTSVDCDQIVGCDDPDRPFCDEIGEHPASDGVGHTCIGDPLATGCEGANDCTNGERPFCVDMVCVQCEVSVDCDVAMPLCDPDSHLCGACSLDDDCEDRVGATRCFTDDGVCVGCLEAADCSAATAPVCDDASHACRGCIDDGECASEVCDFDAGSCVDDADVIYVETGGAAGTCSQTAPCATIAQGLAAVSGARTTIKVRPGTYTEPVAIAGTTVTITGEGATVQPGVASTSAFVISNGANVTLRGLTITGTTGTGARGVLCQTAGATPTVVLQGVQVASNIGVGVSATDCDVTIEGSTIASNTGGGVQISAGTFSLTNNWIVVNGGGTTLLGGVELANVSSAAGSHVVEFNTIYLNNSNDGFPGGVNCPTVGVPLTFSNNIVYGNESTNQIGGAMCSFTFSNIGPTAAAGNGNINMAPVFVDVGTSDFHLDAASPGVDVADADATIVTDIDGDTRPQGDAPDMGADEVVP